MLHDSTRVAAVILDESAAGLKMPLEFISNAEAIAKEGMHPRVDRFFLNFLQTSQKRASGIDLVPHRPMFKWMTTFFFWQHMQLKQPRARPPVTWAGPLDVLEIGACPEKA
jgi:hypothetical protein